MDIPTAVVFDTKSLVVGDRDSLSGWVYDPFCSFESGLAKLAARLSLPARTMANLKRALAALDESARAAFLERHRHELKSFDQLGPKKYADFLYWTFRGVLVAEWLDLDNRRAMRLLDIGMGSGSFAMVAQSMGHQVVGTDVPDPWYDELCRLARVTRHIVPVVRGRPYFVPGGPFDLVTIMLPTFHRRTLPNGDRDYWTVNDWHLFLSGVAHQLLGGDGRIFILMPLDKSRAGAVSYSPLLEWADSRGARLGCTLPGAPINHILFEHAAEQLSGKAS